MISFIIPTLNEEKVVGSLLKNLRQVTKFPYEIIVSDGGSKDGTVRIAKASADVVVENLNGQRQTISQGRNLGAKVSKGDFLVFLDADVFLPNIENDLISAVKLFESNKKLSGLSGWVRVFPERETWADYIGYVILSDWQFYIKNNLLKIGATCGEFQMMRKSDFEKIGGFREDLVVGEDMDLFYRLSRIGQTKTERALMVYHTGRRAHELGWLKLVWEWIKNWFVFTFKNKSHSKEWKVIR